MNFQNITNFLLFLLSVVLISLSGVMSPGPLTAVSVAKGYKNKNAGILISLGHSVVEIPLIFLLYLGLVKIFSSSIFKIILSFIGGIILLYLGFLTIKEKNNYISEGRDLPYNSFLAGVVTTSSNPYFFLWWATIGSGLILTSTSYGIAGIIVFSIVHLLCDFIWYTFLTNIVFKTKKFLNINFYKVILTICGLTLIFFGTIFIINSFRV